METSEFVQAVTRTARRHGMDLSRPLALVSGGPDSVALLRALVELGSEVSVLHVDHALRGEESRADARFVEELCEWLGVGCELRTLDLASGDLHNPHNLQERARGERYRIAGEMVGANGGSCIALGHNSGDVAETLLLNLARGSGTRGIASIPPVRGMVVRPLLERSRGEILAYLDALGQPYRTDPTNLTDKYARNRVRLEVIPVLEELYPGASRNLSRAARLAREDLEALEGLAEGLVERRGREVVIFPKDSLLKDSHPALARHAVRIAYRSLTEPETPPLHAALVEAVLEVSREESGTRTLDLPGGVVAAARFGEEVALYYPGPAVEGEVTLLAGEETRFGDWRVRVTRVPRFDAADASRAEVAYLRGSGGPYRVRTAREGDTIRPLGLGGSKRVFRAMMDRRVPRDRRRATPVVVGGEGEIAWIFLGEIAEEFAVVQETEEILRLEVEEL